MIKRGEKGSDDEGADSDEEDNKDLFKKKKGQTETMAEEEQRLKREFQKA